MLAKIAPRFVISRVIQTAYYADFMSVELTKQIIGESAISFYYDDPKKYYVMLNPFRNATSTAISHHWPLPRNSLTSSKQRNTRKLSRSCLSTMRFAPFMKNSMSLLSS